ncbi:MAG TPA: cytochrome b/b6 domain-containing protein [Alphaproteobacteria bacterium]|nr:cytochrome b/b6 domain-containing protein [Alphaproteobacteria bacterium]
MIWDAPTRLFHWLAAVLVAAAYATWRLNWMDWHARAGYALLTLVVFRLLWGGFGSETARFSRFIASPRAAARHLMRLFRREPDRQVGHNPAGGWMVLLLLALLLGETLTGLYVNNDVADVGPLTELVPAPVANLISALHDILWQALAAAVALHILIVLVYWAVKRHNLVLPMITGRKLLPPDIRPPLLVGWPRALLLFACSTLIAAALVNFL